MSNLTLPQRVDLTPSGLSFLWLEITGKCQLNCAHCYADSGPLGTHGLMTVEQWKAVIDQAVDVGVKWVQFIGGEPTLHPGLVDLIHYCLARTMRVEVFSNLVTIRDDLWEVFSCPGVSLATSFYSDSMTEHEQITGRRGSYLKTTKGITEAVSRGIPIRVGVIGVRSGQHVEEAVKDLKALGVSDIGIDYLRQVGRGQRDERQSVSQLCGNCANGVLAIGPDGLVWPCVFTRWLPVGNIREASLRSIMQSRNLIQTREDLVSSFKLRQGDCRPTCGPNCSPCFPESCGPCTPICTPRDCTPDCAPNCWPMHTGPPR